MPTSNPSSTTPPRPESSTHMDIIERNVRALVDHAAEQERAKSTADRVASAISTFAGSMTFVYIHAVALVLWIAIQKEWIPGLHNFGLTFTRLGSLASLEAIFLATFVLIAQNRMAEQEEIRNHLDVQVSLLNEHETTHILRLVVEMAEKMGLPGAQDPEIKQLIRDVEPKQMIDQIEVHSDASVDDGRS